MTESPTRKREQTLDTASLDDALDYLRAALLQTERDIPRIRRLAAALRNTPCPPGSTSRLVDLCRIARRERGRGSEIVEEAVWMALQRLADPETLSFLAETLRLTPRRDRFVNKRRRLAVATLVQIHIEHQDDRALAVVDELLTNPSPIIRSTAPRLLAEIYTETGYPMPTAVIDRLFELMETDPLPPVRFAAARALCDHGLVSERKVWAWVEAFE